MSKIDDMRTPPPLGIKPRFIVESQRITEISEGIIRFLEAKHPIPIEWIEEYNELINKRSPK